MARWCVLNIIERQAPLVNKQTLHCHGIVGQPPHLRFQRKRSRTQPATIMSTLLSISELVATPLLFLKPRFKSLHRA